MPVTKTAKRALRVSEKKGVFNKILLSRLETLVRQAKKSKTKEKITSAMAFLDKAAAKNAIHRNKAARIKSVLSKLLPKVSKKKSAPKKKK